MFDRKSNRYKASLANIVWFWVRPRVSAASTVAVIKLYLKALRLGLDFSVRHVIKFSEKWQANINDEVAEDDEKYFIDNVDHFFVEINF